MLSEITITSNNGTDEIQLTENGKTKSIKRELNGDFAAQRNYALGQASGDWVLFIDSDEKLSGPLIIPSGYDAFYLKRLDHFFGRKLHHGEAGSIKLIRLAKKDYGTWVGKVHEVWQGKGKVGELKIHLIHFPHPTVREFIKKINSYTTIRAAELKKFSFLELIKPPAKFLDNYFLKLGFLDGLAGFVMAYMMSLHSLIVRVKLYEKQNT